MALVENYTEPADTNPAAEFDVEAWLTDAQMPEEAAEVYKRADVIAELQVVKSQIETQRAASQAEKTSHGDTVLRNLERRYDDMVKTFCDSKLTIYVRALNPDRLAALRVESDERTQGKDKQGQNEDFGYAILSASIVAVRAAGGERTPVTWTRKQVKDIEHAIGTTQMKEVLNARLRAQNGLPRVDADFLHRPSGSDDGQG
jgi:hypothetical protein